MRLSISIAIILLIIVSNYCFSQSTFREGFIQNLKNDTISGFIEYSGGWKNIRECVFKENDKADVKRFSPDQIKAFWITDADHIISMDSIATGVEGNIFVRQLVDGIIDVFYYRKAGGEEIYLVQTADGKFYELRNSNSKLSIDGNSYQMNRKKYVGLLKYILRDSPSLSQKANNVQFTHS